MGEMLVAIGTLVASIGGLIDLIKNRKDSKK